MAARVLVVLDTAGAWSRGILRGFVGVANQQGWTVLHYHTGADLGWLAEAMTPNAAVLGPAIGSAWPEALSDCVRVAANLDLSASGIASVCLDDERVGETAFRHLSGRGLQNVAVFRFDDAPFGATRERSFCQAATKAGARVAPGWWQAGAPPPRAAEHPTELVNWIVGLPKPCGVFTCCDAWARVVTRYARVAGVRIPEDLALVGADNDALECELIAPPLSSVAVPWNLMGEHLALLVAEGLAGNAIDGQRVVVPPLDVVTRRSSDTLAISDPLVVRAVEWIQTHAPERMTVPMVASAVNATRQRLERRFRGILGRTVAQEIRRTRVEGAKHLLTTTTLALPDVARESGFTTAALLSEAFRRELGVSPGRFRRDRRRLHGASS
jgi:LacI family transcriptional regulator